jgi:hypothetical protein
VSIVGVPSTGSRLVAAAREAGLSDDRALNAPDMAGAVELARGLATAGAVVLLAGSAEL